MKATLASWTILAVLTLASTVASGAAQRTFVASGGVDTNPCSINLPCRSFGKAIGQTLTGGEVIVQDAAGYGIVTITKSVSIIAPSGVYAGISVFSGQTGVTINGAGIVVVLRGLSINGVGAGSVNGVRLAQAARLRIESCVVTGLASTAILHDATGAELVILDTIVRDNGGAGIAISGDVNVVLDHVRVEHNAVDGLYVTAGAAIGRVDVRNSVFSHNGFSGVAAFIPGPAALTEVVIEDSVISQNGVDGIFAGGISNGYLVVTLRRNSIAGNGSAGVSAFSGGGGGGVVDVHATENTFLRNVLTQTKADGPSVRVLLSHNVFAYALSGMSFRTVNGGQTISWTDNVGYQTYFGTAISTQPRF